MEAGTDTSLRRTQNYLYNCKLKANKNQQVGNEKSECQLSVRKVSLVGGTKEGLSLVEREAVDYEVKASLATLEIGMQVTAASEGFKVGIRCGPVNR